MLKSYENHSYLDFKLPFSKEEVGDNTVDTILVEKSVRRKSTTRKVPKKPRLKGHLGKTFSELPETVRVKILSYLNYRDRILAQLVCRQFRNDIRLRVGLLTKVYDSSKSGLTFLRDIVVEALIIGRYEKPFYTPLKILFQPENVTSLIFDYPIILPYFDAFISRCQNVKFLYIKAAVLDGTPQPSISRTVYGGYEWRFPEQMLKIPVKLSDLKEISINFSAIGHCACVSRILSVINAPNLSSLQLKLTGLIDKEITTSIHFAVIKFLKRARKVKKLTVSTDQRKDNLKLRNNQFLGIPRMEINNLANHLQFEELVLTEPCVFFHTWYPILYSQQHLTVFQIFHAMMWPYLRDVIYFNSTSLKKIGIHAILREEKEKSMMMDLTIFGHCTSLVELFICIAGPVDVGHADLIKFDALPKSLEIFSLKNGLFRTSEVLELRNMPNLKSIGLISCTYFKGYGVTTPAFKRLMSIRSLQELLISGFCVSNRTSKELSKILQLTDTRLKDKHSTCFFYDPKSRPRYFVNEYNFIVFTIYPNEGRAESL